MGRAVGWEDREQKELKKCSGWGDNFLSWCGGGYTTVYNYKNSSNHTFKIGEFYCM